MAKVRPLVLAGVVSAAVVVWIACYFIIDWLVLQLYPLPQGLWGHASMREIIATRPDAAVALNVGGELLVLAAVAFVASRRLRARAPHTGALVTGVVVILSIANALATANLRWVTVVGFVLFAIVGVAAARRGAAS